MGGVSILFGGSIFFWEGCPFHLGVVFYCERGGPFLLGWSFIGVCIFSWGVVIFNMGGVLLWGLWYVLMEVILYMGIVLFLGGGIAFVVWW